MKGKKILAALGFFSIAGVAGGCSQPAPNIRYQIETDQPCQTMAYFSASDAWGMQFIGLWPQEQSWESIRWMKRAQSAKSRCFCIFRRKKGVTGMRKPYGLSLIHI